MGWKSKKDGTHFNDDKIIRSSGTPGTEVNIEIDNNSDDFAEDVNKSYEELQRSKFIEKRDSLTSALNDADRRFNIAINKINTITDRLHELEIDRNLALRKKFLVKQIENNPEISKELIDEFNNINADTRDILTYEEIA